MLFVESSHGPGVIGFTGGELSRYHTFTMCWSVVNVPPGTRNRPALSYDTACNSNAIIAWTLKEAPEAQWVWIMDDDHVFAPTVLLQLLDKQVDVVVPLYAQRQPPFRPCAFKAEMPDGSFEIHNWTDLEGKSGLLPVVSAGKGGILIRRRVLERMAEPWFEWKGKVGEDHYFFKKIRALGYQPYVDLDTPLGHTSPIEIWPHTEGGRWCGAARLGGSAVVQYWDAKYQGPVGQTD